MRSRRASASLHIACSRKWWIRGFSTLVSSRGRSPTLTHAQFEAFLGSVEQDVVKPDSGTYAQLLQACGKFKALPQGKRVHAHIIKSGMEQSIFIQNHLINMYGKCGRPEDARFIFGKMLHHQNVVSWNNMIAAYAQDGQCKEALNLFREMQLQGVMPDTVTFTTILNACASPSALEEGKIIHDCIVRCGFETDVILCSALVNMYGKCGSLVDARRTFDGMQKRNVISWTALIAAYAQHGHFEHALELFWSMEHEQVAPNAITVVTVLNLCGNFSALAEGKALHAYIAKSELASDTGVLNGLVHMYGKCRRMDDALEVFESIPQRTLVSWNAVITSCAWNGRGDEAFQLFQRMQAQNVIPDMVTFTAMLGACASSMSLEQGRMVHESIVQFGFESDVLIGTSLVNMYGKCGSLEDARAMFDRMKERNVVSWNAMLSTYAQHGQGKEVLQVYECMLLEGLSPNYVTFFTVVNACSSVSRLNEVRANIVEAGLESDVMVCNALVNTYGKCGSLEETWDVFNRTMKQDAVTWNGLITAYAQRGLDEEGFQLFRQMQLEGVTPDRVTLLSVCGMCSSPAALEEIIPQVVSGGYDLDPVIGTILVSMYGKCGSVGDALSIFQKMVRRDIIPWNAMIAVYVQNERFKEAFLLFGQVQLEGFKPDVTSIVCVLSACGVLAIGKAIHAGIVGSPLERDVAVRNALVNMYGKCGNLENAAAMFAGTLARDGISWNVMIAALVQDGRGRDALRLFREMQQEGMVPDKVSFVNVLNACDSPEMLAAGRHIHARIASAGLESDVVVATALTNMYSKCQSIEDAAAMFGQMKDRNIVSWNGMVAAYAQHGHAQEALQLFRWMQLEAMKPNSVTFISLLDACASLTALQEGKSIHARIIESGVRSDIAMENALVNMYGKCGNLEDAREIFERMQHRTVVSWSSMIAAYAQHGHAGEALKFFHLMQREGLRPNYITFISTLCACSHAGMVHEGCAYYASMITDHNVVPTDEHYGCIIDLLGRAGWIDEAEDFIRRMPSGADVVAWMTLLGACSNYGDAEQGSKAAQRVLKLDPKYAPAYVALSNTFQAAGAASK